MLLMQVMNKASCSDLFSKIFDELETTIATILPDWSGDLSDFDIFGIDYYYRSRKKIASTLLENIFEDIPDDEDTPTNETIAYLSHMLVLRFGYNWAKVFSAYYLTDYKPLENYSLVEVEKPQITKITDTEANTKTMATTDIFPFDSDTAQHSSESTQEGLIADNHGKTTETEKGNRTTTRSGNIGVTTSQQMLSSELDIRRFDWLMKIYEDVDKVLTRNYFNY